MTRPCELDAVEARALIGARALSPVELLDDCLARIDRVNCQVNAVVAIDRERARREAREAEAAVLRGDPLGPLHGLPIGIKDMIDTEGLRTTYGSRVYADHVPTSDDPIIAGLRAAGGIVCFKTNTPEWAAGGNTFNPVYGVSGNPFAPELTCGGSSGGSAVALATGMLPLAHGSDNAGSLRIPASLCGVTGMRPTAGLVPSAGRAYGPLHFAVEGPMGRTARDTALLLSAMARFDPMDPLSSHVDPALRAPLPPLDLSGLRVAFTPDLGGFAPIEPDLAALFTRRAGKLRSVFRECAEASPDLAGADRVYETIRAAAFVGTWHARMQAEPDRWGRLVTQNYREGLGAAQVDVALANVEWTRMYRAAQRFFESFDLLVLPTVSVRPWPKHEIYPASVAGHPTSNYLDWVRMTYGITLLNHPCISIPCGTDAQGFPFGLQLVARRGADAFLMRAAIALEELLARDPETARPRPDIDRLAAVPVTDPLARPVG
jgi:Asp-tRNA(Asn)/Glu-tRNA(Gln) amidotransferase A subunit family amidase